jgi:TonB family protein
MTSHSMSRPLASLVVSSLFLFPTPHAQELATESISAPSRAVGVYPNNSGGLRQLLQDMLVAVKNDDRAKVQSLIADLEIPNYEHWFTTTFGQEKGESWAEPYGKSLQQNKNDFQDLLIQLAHQDGEVSVQKLDTTKRYSTLSSSLDEYLADWKKSDGSGSQRVEHIGYFYFIEGKFRWNSNVRFVRIQKANSGSLVPGKPVPGEPTKRVRPDYPEEARRKRIQGTVVLNATIRKDGSVTVQSVASGDPVLSPAAINAARQWHYEPILVNGQPVETPTQIQVLFMLATP